VRNAKARALGAAEAVAVTGEHVLDAGVVWATQVKGARVKGKPRLLFRARRQYLVALTDRRLLVFERRAKDRRAALGAADLALGKRYEFFTLERRRRYPTLLQLVLRRDNDDRLVLEFRPSQRGAGRTLEQHLASVHPAAIGAPGASPEGALTPAEEAERDAAEAFWGPR
jgi:hypothetical protein